jgi:hypothetical protein
MERFERLTENLIEPPRWKNFYESIFHHEGSAAQIGF